MIMPIAHQKLARLLRSPWLALTIFLSSLGISTRANDIFVTTVVDKISSTDGCSLKEAIYSANLRTNLAVSPDATGTDQFITTACVAGTGNDTIILPSRGIFSLSTIAPDVHNFLGPTATPLIFSTITIEANGSLIQWTGVEHARAFAVASASVSLPSGRSVSGTGSLTLRNAHVKGFRQHGGNGAIGGGGGLGAGGAIYVKGGAVTIDSCTFDGNGALGGNGAAAGGTSGGGGGGLGGNGGPGSLFGAGGGGGGSFGDGGSGVGGGGGGGGGGTDASGQPSPASGNGGTGGFCGGPGGAFGGPGPGFANSGGNGSDAACPGGGGGGGGLVGQCAPIQHCTSGHGGNGNYGGGGGGGAYDHTNGGNGGFGGGGGAPATCPFCGPLDGNANAGKGGFGAGGGAGGGTTSVSGAPHSAFTSSGAGGLFGGGGNATGGGGGAALGGAIFNDGGGVRILNSTFTGNSVSRGNGGLGTNHGADAGGAIFSLNGHTTLLNATISGNHSSSFGGGVAVYSNSSSAIFTIENSIIANNGPRECSGMGPGTTVGNFVGNLIEQNDNCFGVVTSANPLLGPLQNNQGPTPTMAIPKTSPAINAADADTSLPFDQRGQARPSTTGFDIGAFELCLHGIPPFQFPCIISGGIVQTALLTVQVTPSAGGTTTPGVGTHAEPVNSVVLLNAAPNAGYRFVNWSSNVADPTNHSTAIVMGTTNQTVTATFALCNCAKNVTGSVTVTRGSTVLNPATGRFDQTVTVKNDLASTIMGPISLVLDNLSSDATLFNATGKTDSLETPAGSPYVSDNVNLAAGQSISFLLEFTDPSHGTITYTTRVLAGPGLR